MSETEQTASRPRYDSEVSIRDVLRPLWLRKWLIGGTTVVAALVSVIVALLLPDVYRAQALLVPNNQERATGLSALAAQYGGLANLAGIDMGADSTNKATLGLEVLRSRKFIAEFIERHDIMVPLMAAKEWDAETGELRIDPRIYDMTAQEWVRDAKPPRTASPSQQEAYETFSKSLSVTQDAQSGFVAIAVDHLSPQVAKQWVDWLVLDINTATMRHDVAQAEQAIAYLNEQIASTSLADLKSVFFSLIEEQTKTVMLANISDEYLFRTIDPAVVPERRAKPKRKVIVVLSTFLGFMGAAIFALASHGGPPRSVSKQS